MLNNPSYVKPGQQHKQCVAVIQILKCDLNFGYQIKRWSVVESLNGVPLESLKHLVKTYRECQERADPWLTFEFEDSRKVVLDTSLSAATDAELQRLHKIPSCVSLNILDELSKETEEIADKEVLTKPKRRKTAR